MKVGFRAGMPPDQGFREVQRWRLRTLGDLRPMRRGMRDRVETALGAPVDGVFDPLLLVANELASNALRHGRGDAVVVLAHGSAGWLIDVIDLAPERDPTPAVDRTPGEGGYGLHLVAELAAAMGWYHEGPNKHVWGQVAADRSEGRPAAVSG